MKSGYSLNYYFKSYKQTHLFLSFFLSFFLNINLLILIYHYAIFCFSASCWNRIPLWRQRHKRVEQNIFFIFFSYYFSILPKSRITYAATWFVMQNYPFLVSTLSLFLFVKIKQTQKNTGLRTNQFQRIHYKINFIKLVLNWLLS